MKKLAIVFSFLLCTTAVFAHDGKSCDMAKHAQSNGKACKMEKGKTAELSGRIFTKDNVRYFQVKDGDVTYPICEHSKAAVDKLEGANVHVKAKLINCSDHDGKEVLFIEKADKI